MSSNLTPRRALVNRYWKRPKPRIYECNIRDAERFYKDSYNEYLLSKQFAASYGKKDIEEEFATRWTLNRMNSSLDAASSYLDPVLREGSSSGFSSSDYKEPSDDIGYRTSRVAFTRRDSLTENGIDSRPSFRASSLVQSARDSTPDCDLRGVEERLERIRRLKEELGIKGDIPNEILQGNSTASRSILKQSSRRSPSETRGTKSEYAQNSYSSVSASSRSRGTEPAPEEYESKYSNRSEHSSRLSSKYNNSDDKFSARDQSGISYKYSSDDKFSARDQSGKSYKYGSDDKFSALDQNGKSYKYGSEDKFSALDQSGKSYKYGSDDTDSYSAKRSLRKDNSNYGDDEESLSKFSSESKVSNRISSRKAAASASASNGVDNMDEDDQFVSNMRKKFPTSEEILERIKKMDADL